MLSIRLKRIGKKNQAAFRVVIGERRSKLKGDYTEDLGWYNPSTKKSEIKIDRVKYWLSVGAKLSDTVNNILIGSKQIEGKKMPKHKQPSAAKSKATAEAKKTSDAKAAAATPAAAPVAEEVKA